MFAIASAGLFAIRPIFVKLVYAEGVDPTTLIGFRMLFSLPLYALMLILLLRDKQRSSRLTKRNILAASLVGLLGYYIASFFDLLGLQYVSAQLGRMVLYLYPTIVVVIGVLFFARRVTWITWVSLIISYAGVLIIFGHDLHHYGQDIVKGSLLIVVSATAFSLYLLFGKPLIDEMGSRLFTSIALISASLAILLHYGITRPILAPQINSVALFWVFIIALFCTVIPTFFTTAAVERIGSVKTGIVAMIGPGFTSVFAVLIISEVFTVYHASGIALTIFGVWFLSKDKQTS